MREMLRTLGRVPYDTSPQESRLIAFAQRGDTAAFDRLVVLHADALRRFVARRVPTGQVDDMMQETWIAAYGGIGRYTATARFKTWLYAIAANKCRDLHRRDVPTAELVDAGVPEPAYNAVEVRSAVGCALEQLSPTFREVIDLYYYDRLTLAEIASVTGKNLNTVKYQFYRAHQEIAAKLEGFDA